MQAVVGALGFGVFKVWGCRVFRFRVYSLRFGIRGLRFRGISGTHSELPFEFAVSNVYLWGTCFDNIHASSAILLTELQVKPTWEAQSNC